MKYLIGRNSKATPSGRVIVQVLLASKYFETQIALDP